MPDYSISQAHFDKLMEAFGFLAKQAGQEGDPYFLMTSLQTHGSLVADTPENGAILDGFKVLARWQELTDIKASQGGELLSSDQAELDTLTAQLGL